MRPDDAEFFEPVPPQNVLERRERIIRAMETVGAWIFVFCGAALMGIVLFSAVFKW